MQDETLAPERRLTTLKDFTRLAWEECRKPLGESTGSAEVRFDIYSTWTLLLCLQHAETESERCKSVWKPVPWRTEAVALRHLFLEHSSIRRLTAILRWLRWVHQETPASSSSSSGYGASSFRKANFERTRRALQLKAALPTPLQEGPALHPDWSVQCPGHVNSQDLDDERLLLRELWTYLRRGNLYGALKLCADREQSWRTALLQGMFPFADSAEEFWYNTPDMDEDEDLLGRMKEDHTDWIELGNGEMSDANGNPWRRVWKEQCWDTASNSLRGGLMDLHELAIYGFCAGHREAMMPLCVSSWMDKCWAELHCLKEWLVERLLSEGRGSWCDDGCNFIGEGDGGVCDVLDTPEEQALRSEKLSGRLSHVAVEDIGSVIGLEVSRLLASLRLDPTPLSIQQQARRPFAQLQATLIEAAWAPGKVAAALDMLKFWVEDNFAGEECPFLVKKFASYFAMLQKSFQQEAVEQDVGMRAVSEESAMDTSADWHQPTIDHIVRALIDDMVLAAAGSWVEQCLEGTALDYIAEHLAALSSHHRVDAYVSLLLHLGSRCTETSMKGSLGINIQDGLFVPEQQQPAMAEKAASRSEMTAKLLQRCLWVFWQKFPGEAFALLAVLVKRVLHADEPVDTPLQEAALSPDELVLTLQCITAAWLVVRSLPDDSSEVEQSLQGLEAVVEGELPGLASSGDFCNFVMDRVALPLFVDVLMTLLVRAPSVAVVYLEELQQSSLWRDAHNTQPRCWVYLLELQWFAQLHKLHAAWQASTKTIANDSALEEQRQVRLAKDAVVGCARNRMKKDRPLLEPQSAACTALPAARWQRLRQMLVEQCLDLLLAVYQYDCDFDGAVCDLAVLVAESPWVLKLLQPTSVRSFLLKLARLPAVGAS